MNFFAYSTPLALLKADIKQHADERGYKAKLAQAAGCQRSFLSQVLAGRAQLSLEQGFGLTEFWKSPPAEQEYLLNLIQFERAGSEAMRRFFSCKLEDARKNHFHLGNRFKVKVLEREAVQIYYSSWLYSATHMLLTIPEMRTSDAIARRLGLPLDVVDQVLVDLEQIALARRESGRWLPLDSAIHVAKESPLNVLNHSNWRQQALGNILLKRPKDLHYTAVYSLSRADVERLREKVSAFIDETRKLVAPSKEQEVVAFLIDYFLV